MLASWTLLNMIIVSIKKKWLLSSAGPAPKKKKKKKKKKKIPKCPGSRTDILKQLLLP
jgi:hypothetical protein